MGTSPRWPGGYIARYCDDDLVTVSAVYRRRGSRRDGPDFASDTHALYNARVIKPMVTATTRSVVCSESERPASNVRLKTVQPPIQQTVVAFYWSNSS